MKDTKHTFSKGDCKEFPTYMFNNYVCYRTRVHQGLIKMKHKGDTNQAHQDHHDQSSK